MIRSYKSIKQGECNVKQEDSTGKRNKILQNKKKYVIEMKRKLKNNFIFFQQGTCSGASGHVPYQCAVKMEECDLFLCRYAQKFDIRTYKLVILPFIRQDADCIITPEEDK